MATTLYVNTPELDAISAVIQEAVAEVAHAFDRAGTGNQMPLSDTAVSPAVLDQALSRFLDVLQRVDNDRGDSPSRVLPVKPTCDSINKPVLNRAKLSAAANQGLQLLETLSEWASSLGLPRQENQIKTVMVMTALWVARHGGELETIESVVNTLAEIANATTEQQELAELSYMMGELAYAISGQTKFDFENAERHRPWRVLNLNRGITATRSHDTRIMENAFDDLIRNIPEDAESFFRQGVQQTEQLDYPDHVRNVVFRYYRESKSRAVH
ncbi:MAG: hypothetical protein PVJ39_01615 [Gammaproteobacteria bacterium]|jgi:hypothetical protein